MADRRLLGAADVGDDVLTAMVAQALEVPADLELVTCTVAVAEYDLEALTTGGRFRVSGTAQHAGRGSTYAFFVKLVQSWARSPLFRAVPPELREVALASVPWRTEPLIYRSDLADRLPAGLSLPRAYGVFNLDEESAALWLEVIDVDAARWDADRFSRAAYLLGRLAASPTVAPLATLGCDDVVRSYARGRLAHQVLPALQDRALWQHPLLAASFDQELQAGLLAAAETLPVLIEELAGVATGTAHGDACTRNLLVSPNTDGFVLIDFGFWCRAPLGFDLGQLVLGEVQMGERPAAELPVLDETCLAAYQRGLHDEGCAVSLPRLRRAHALQMLLFFGLSAVPFEDLGRPLTPQLIAKTRGRSAAARFVLDLVDRTGSALVDRQGRNAVLFARPTLQALGSVSPAKQG